MTHFPSYKRIYTFIFIWGYRGSSTKYFWPISKIHDWNDVNSRTLYVCVSLLRAPPSDRLHALCFIPTVRLCPCAWMCAVCVNAPRQKIIMSMFVCVLFSLFLYSTLFLYLILPLYQIIIYETFIVFNIERFFIMIIIIIINLYIYCMKSDKTFYARFFYMSLFNVHCIILLLLLYINHIYYNMTYIYSLLHREEGWFCVAFKRPEVRWEDEYTLYT